MLPAISTRLLCFRTELGLNLNRAAVTEEFSGQRIEFEIAETQSAVTADVHAECLFAVVYTLRSDEEVLNENS